MSPMLQTCFLDAYKNQASSKSNEDDRSHCTIFSPTCRNWKESKSPKGLYCKANDVSLQCPWICSNNQDTGRSGQESHEWPLGHLHPPDSRMGCQCPRHALTMPSETKLPPIAVAIMETTYSPPKSLMEIKSFTYHLLTHVLQLVRNHLFPRMTPQELIMLLNLQLQKKGY